MMSHPPWVSMTPEHNFQHSSAVPQCSLGDRGLRDTRTIRHIYNVINEYVCVCICVNVCACVCAQVCLGVCVWGGFEDGFYAAVPVSTDTTSLRDVLHFPLEAVRYAW